MVDPSGKIREEHIEPPASLGAQTAAPVGWFPGKTALCGGAAPRKPENQDKNAALYRRPIGRRARADMRQDLVPRPPRPRRQQRERARELRKQVRRTEQLAGQLPGASSDKPIDVASASVVEQKARATSCIQCGGDLEVRGDRATSTARGVLRVMALVCRRCHAPRTLWFRIAPRPAN